MLKLKLQNFGYLMWKISWLEKTLMLGKTESKRRSGQQRMRWLLCITNLMDMNLSKLQEIVEDRGGWHAAVQGVTKSGTWSSEWKTQTRHFNLGRTDKVGLLSFSIYPCFIHFIKVLNFSQQCYEIFTIEVLYIFVLILFLGSWFFCHCSIKCVVLFSVSFKHLKIQLIFTYWSNHHVKFTYSIKMRMGFFL